MQNKQSSLPSLTLQVFEVRVKVGYSYDDLTWSFSPWSLTLLRVIYQHRNLFLNDLNRAAPRISPHSWFAILQKNGKKWVEVFIHFHLLHPFNYFTDCELVKSWPRNYCFSIVILLGWFNNKNPTLSLVSMTFSKPSAFVVLWRGER